MLVNIVLFYAAVAVFYFAFQYVRSRFQTRVEPYTPPPTIDIVFVVRIFMQDGTWGLIMQREKHYLRLPMLNDIDANTYLGRDPSFVHEFDRINQHTGLDRRTRIVVFTAPDELAMPKMMPKTDIVYISAATVVDMIKKMRPELSMTSFHIMHRIQGEIHRITGKNDFGWFTGN